MVSVLTSLGHHLPILFDNLFGCYDHYPASVLLYMPTGLNKFDGGEHKKRHLDHGVMIRGDLGIRKQGPHPPTFFL